MSATNRGAIRNESDFYKTPYWAIEKIVDELGAFYGLEFLEPTAGDGAIVSCLKNNFEDITVTANEIRSDEQTSLFNAGADRVYNLDFLKSGKYNPTPDVIITNPPYSIAKEIIEHCFDIAPDAEIIMLLRLNFLGSQKRKEFFKKHPVTQLYVLSKRPSFTGHGTDATEYAWFVWSKCRNPLITVV